MEAQEKNVADVGGAKRHAGSCHCGAIRFEVDYDLSKGGTRCNCSICTKTATLNAIVKPQAFSLVTGEESLGFYEWGGKTGRRFFCKHCGVQCFGRGYLEQIGGEYVSFSVSSLDDVELTGLPVIYWDGRHDNWQAGPRPVPWPILSSPV